MTGAGQTGAGQIGAGQIGAADIVAALAARRLTVATAESLTGGMLVAELVAVPGASAVVRGGIVAYSTELKHTVLGVDPALLAAHGPVHPGVAAQMARGVRSVMAVNGLPADIGISTTGVAGPAEQDGHPVGTVFIAVASEGHSEVVSLELGGDRDHIRRAVVSEALSAVGRMLARQ